MPWLRHDLYVKTPCSCLHDKVEHYRGRAMCACEMFDALMPLQAVAV